MKRIVVIALAMIMMVGTASPAQALKIDAWARSEATSPRRDTQAASRSAVRSQTYTVRRGDTLDSIARQHKVPGGFERLHYVNQGKIDSADVIEVGIVLTIPVNSGKVIAYVPPAPPAPAPESVEQEVASSTPSSSSPASSPAASSPPPTSATGDIWYALAECESGGDWGIDTGNGFYGGLQFTLSSWQAVGGSGYPHHASASEQIMRGQMLQQIQGWGAWPGCAAKLGLL